MLPALYPHQIKMLRAAVRHLDAGNAAALVYGPTGSGKGRVIAELVKVGLKRKLRVGVIAPRVVLIDQYVNEVFTAWGVPLRHVGVVQADHPMTDASKPVQVISTHSLDRRGVINYPFDVLLVDEAHMHQKPVIAWIEAHPEAQVIGFTATPNVTGLDDIYSSLIDVVSVQDLVASKLLAEPFVFRRATYDTADVAVVNGDYVQTALQMRVAEQQRVTADVVANYAAVTAGYRAICFAAGKAHARDLTKRFNKAGFPAKVLLDDTPAAERRAIKAAFANSEIKVLVSVDVISVGFDAPETEVIILARPTRSIAKHIQMCGRGLRIDEKTGKDAVYIFDHCDSVLNCGFIEDFHVDGIGRPVAPAPAKACPECDRVCGVSTKTCPECGHVFSDDPFTDPRAIVSRHWIESETERLRLIERDAETARRLAEAEARRNDPLRGLSVSLKGAVAWARARRRVNLGTTRFVPQAAYEALTTRLNEALATGPAELEATISTVKAEVAALSPSRAADDPLRGLCVAASGQVVWIRGPHRVHLGRTCFVPQAAYEAMVIRLNEAFYPGLDIELEAAIKSVKAEVAVLSPRRTVADPRRGLTVAASGKVTWVRNRRSVHLGKARFVPQAIYEAMVARLNEALNTGPAELEATIKSVKAEVKALKKARRNA